MQNSEARVLTLAVGALATQQSTTDERLDHLAEAVGAVEERVIALGHKTTTDIGLLAETVLKMNERQEKRLDSIGRDVAELKTDVAELKQVGDTRHTAVTAMLQTLLDRTAPTP